MAKDIRITPASGLIAFSGSNEQSTITVSDDGKIALQGSGSTIFDVQGSQGQLFSVTDSLVGSLFSVNDISGLPILEVFDNDKVVMGTFGQNTLVVTGSNVGVGIENPSTKLQVADGGVISFYRSGNDRKGQLYTNVLGTVLESDSIGNDPLYLRSPGTSGVLLFFTSTSEKMRINAAGNVGIGTTSPQVELHVKGNNGWGETRIEGQTFASGHGASLEFYSEGTALADIYSSTDKHLYFRTNGTTERMRIQANGYVGIGTTDAQMPLQVVNSGPSLTGTAKYSSRFIQDKTNYRGIFLGYDTSGTTGIIGAESGGPASNIAFWNYTGAVWSEKMRITGAGNVGIGTTSPGAKLDVAGDINIDGSSFHTVANDSVVTAPSDEGLVAYYGFDEGSGTNISDKTSRNNTVSTGLSYTTTSIRGTALDGFGGDDKYVVVPNSTDFDFSTGDFAVSMWCQPNSGYNGIHETLIEIGRYTAGILIRPNANQLEVYIQGALTANPALTLSADEWYHIVVTKISSVLYIYANGTLIGSAANTANIQVGEAGYIGRSAHTTGQVFHGIIDEVKIYKDRGLTYGEVRGQYLSRGNSDLVGPIFTSNTGNIGIRVQDPQAPLEVMGTSNVPGDGNEVISVTNTTGGSKLLLGVAENSYGWLQAAEGGTVRSLLLNPNGGNVGIGTTSPSKRLHVYSGAANEGIFMEGTGNGHWFNFRSGTSNLWSMGAQAGLMGWYNRTDSTYKMVITDAGNVGIGTTSPSAKLDVAGAVQIGDASTTPNVAYGLFGYSGIGLGISSGATGANQGIGFWLNNGTAYEAGRWLSGGNLGIGTTSPTEKLHVEGNILATGHLFSDQIQTKQYTSLTGNSGDWYPIGTITDQYTGPVRFSILTYAHSSIDFIVSEAYSLANAHNITVLNGIYGANGGYANVSAVRVKQSGLVEMRLNWTSGPSVQVRITARGTYQTPTLASSLTPTTDTSTVIDSVDNGIGKMRTQRTLEVGSTVLLNYSGDSYLNGGNVGIGTTSPSRKLHVSAGNGDIAAKFENTSSNSTVLHLQTTGDNKSMYFQTDHIYVSSGTMHFGNDTGDLYLRPGASGKVGIGTTSPGEKLDVTGTIRSTANEGKIKINSTATNGKQYEFISIDTGNLGLYDGTAYRLWVGGNGNVGINTTTPGERLDVVGNIRSYSATNNYGQIQNGSFLAVGNHGGTFMLDLDNNGSADLVNIKKSGTSRFYIENGGNVGIGTTSPSAKLEVAGDVRVATSATIGVTSVVASTTNYENHLRVQGKNNYSDGTTWYGNYGQIILHSDSNMTSSARRFMLTNALGNNKFAIVRSADANTDPIVNSTGLEVNSGTADLVIDNTGKIGLGITGPTHKAHIWDTGYNGYTLRLQSGQGNNASGWSGIGFSGESANSKAAVLFQSYGTSYSRGKLVFAVNNDTNQNNASPTDARMVINADGTVGIGITDPQTRLSLGSAQGSGIDFLYNATNAYKNQIKNYWNSSTDTRMDFNIGRTANVAPTTVMSVGYGGNVGIGTTAPSQKLQVNGNIYAYNGELRLIQGYGITWNNGDNYIRGTSGYSLQFTTYDGTSAQVEVLRLTGGAPASGGQRAGIGTSVPQAKLHVEYDIAGEDVVAVDGTNGRLFTVTDDLSDSLFSVNTVAGLPVMEVFADNRVVMGAFNQCDLVVSGSRVGIGTCEPADKLHVSSGNIRITNNSPILYFYDTDVSNLRHRILGGGNAGMEYSADIGNVAAGYHRWDISNTEKMRLIENGNLGINTTNPSNRITAHQGGGVRVTGITSGGYIEMSGDLPGYSANQYPVIKSGGTIHFANNSKYAAYIEGTNTYFGILDSTPTTKVLLHTSGNSYLNGGNVGIGNTSPTFELDVTGNIGIRQGSYAGGQNKSQPIFIPANGSDSDSHYFTLGWKTSARSGEVMHRQGQGPSSDRAFYIEAGSTEAGGICLDENSVNIYGSSDSGTTFRVIDKDSDVVTFEMLQTSWNGVFKGDVIAYGSLSSISDRRIKRNIVPYEDALSKIKQIEVYSYNKITAKDPERVEIGVIAQEIEEVIPELVNTERVSQPEKTAGLEEIKTVDYEHLTAVLVQAMKEQQAQIDELKQEIANLKNK